MNGSLTDRDYGDERDHDIMTESELIAALANEGLIPVLEDPEFD